MKPDADRETCIAPLELEGVDELSARVFRAFMRTLRLHRQLMIRTMAEHGAHPGQAMCLHLLEANEGITQRDLAEALYLARPTVSRMLRGMERAGLVERSPDARDQRLTHVHLTAAGRDLARELRSVAAAHVSETIGKLKTMRILIEEKKSGGTIYSINTDSRHYGGHGLGNLGGVQAERIPCQGRPCSIEVRLPGLSVVVFRLDAP